MSVILILFSNYINTEWLIFQTVLFNYEVHESSTGCQNRCRGRASIMFSDDRWTAGNDGCKGEGMEVRNSSLKHE